MKKKDNGKYNRIGKLHIRWLERDHVTEREEVLKNHLIDFPLLEEQLGLLFEKIVNGKIYLLHIPESSNERTVVTPSRIIMTTAGFEWQFTQTHRDLSEHYGERNADEKQQIITFLEGKIEENTGARKKYFKGQKDLMARVNMPLSSKINAALKVSKDELSMFIENLYVLNNVKEFKSTDIANRIRNQRNKAAYGNLDKRFEQKIVLDLFVLDWLYYVMVLKELGLSKRQIQLSINQLFDRKFKMWRDLC